MTQIGQFARTESGYFGHIRTLTLDVGLTLVPTDPSDIENAPDFRVHLGNDGDGPTIGAAWKRVGEKAGDYLSLAIDDPALPQPIRAHLFRFDADGNAWSLHWSRPSKRTERD